MRILSITAGAAGMYCGSCFRDNALAAELLRRRHDVSLVPMYTPTRTDEDNVSDGRVLFGGISVYLQQMSPLFRRLPRAFDRLWDSPRVISAFANRAAATDASQLGGLTVSMLEGESGVLKKEFDKLVEWIRGEPLPDVINIPNSLLIALAAPLKRAVQRPVCCTLQGEELFLNGLLPQYRQRALALIRAQVPQVDRFIAVSEYCSRYMGALFNIPAAQMAVVPLGIKMDGYAAPAGGSATFTVGYFARVAPEKGLHVLCDAYRRLRTRPGVGESRLVAAGFLPDEHRGYLEGLIRQMQEWGLGGEFEYRGEVDRADKIKFLHTLDVLSVPAPYHEPKAIFLMEAMAAGVPVVQPRHGAFTEIIEKTGGGLLVESGNADALADGLLALWRDPELSRALSAAGPAGVRQHYTVEQMADTVEGIYRELIGARPHFS